MYKCRQDRNPAKKLRNNGQSEGGGGGIVKRTWIN